MRLTKNVVIAQLLCICSQTTFLSKRNVALRAGLNGTDWTSAASRLGTDGRGTCRDAKCHADYFGRNPSLSKMAGVLRKRISRRLLTRERDSAGGGRGKKTKEKKKRLYVNEIAHLCKRTIRAEKKKRAK